VLYFICSAVFSTQKMGVFLSTFSKKGKLLSRGIALFMEQPVAFWWLFPMPRAWHCGAAINKKNKE